MLLWSPADHLCACSGEAELQTDTSLPVWQKQTSEPRPLPGTGQSLPGIQRLDLWHHHSEKHTLLQFTLLHTGELVWEQMISCLCPSSSAERAHQRRRKWGGGGGWRQREEAEVWLSAAALLPSSPTDDQSSRSGGGQLHLHRWGQLHLCRGALPELHILHILYTPISLNIKTGFTGLPDLWRCPVVSGPETLAADPVSPVSCEVGPPWIGLVFQHIPQMLNGIEIWGIWRPSQHLGLSSCFSNQNPEQFLQCGRARYPADRDHCHQGVLLPWKGGLFLQQCLGRWYVSK